MGLFDNKDVKYLSRALDLLRQRKELDKELAEIRNYFESTLKSGVNTKVAIEGDGMVLLKEQEKKVLDMNKVKELLLENPKNLEEFLKSMVTIKQSAFEKYFGIPKFQEVVQSTYVDKSIAFVVK